MNSRPADDIDYTQYGWVPPKQQLSSAAPKSAGDDIDYTQYGYVPPESEESKLKSAAYAIPRIGKDLGESLLGALRSIPGKFESAKTEIPGAADVLTQHPAHAAGQFGAGAVEAIKGLSDIPSNLASYGSNRLHLVSPILSAVMSAMHEASPTTQMYKNILDKLGDPKYQGENLIRGVSRNIPNIVGAAKIASVFNPLKLTSKSIAKDVTETRGKMKDLYNTKYDEFLDKADKSGLGHGLPNAAATVDFKTALVNEPKRVMARIEEFQKNPTVRNAHEAKKDLLKIQRKLTAKNESVGLIGNEPAQLDAVSDAVGKIEGNMFTDSAGKVDPQFADEYRGIQQGYAKDVLPYTRNKALNEFRRGERLSDQLVKSLSSGKFPAQRGKFHKPLMIRRQIGLHPYLTIGGVGGALGTALYKAITGSGGEYES